MNPKEYYQLIEETVLKMNILSPYSINRPIMRTDSRPGTMVVWIDIKVPFGGKEEFLRSHALFDYKERNDKGFGIEVIEKRVNRSIKDANALWERELVKLDKSVPPENPSELEQFLFEEYLRARARLHRKEFLGERP